VVRTARANTRRDLLTKTGVAFARQNALACAWQPSVREEETDSMPAPKKATTRRKTTARKSTARKSTARKSAASSEPRSLAAFNKSLETLQKTFGALAKDAQKRNSKAAYRDIQKGLKALQRDSSKLGKALQKDLEEAAGNIRSRTGGGAKRASARKSTPARKSTARRSTARKSTTRKTTARRKPAAKR
jgi:hypothetical protein